MNRPPEPPPEGVLIEQARNEAGLSVREAARRAGISEGWWRQVVKGYQSLSGGAYGVVRHVPADTVASMAKATGKITPERLASEGQRPDAAEVMRETRQPRPVREPPPGFPSATDEQLASMRPYLAEIEDAVDLARYRNPGATLTGPMVFPRDPAYAALWDDFRKLGWPDDGITWMLSASKAWDAQEAEAGRRHATG